MAKRLMDGMNFVKLETKIYSRHKNFMTQRSQGTENSMHRNSKDSRHRNLKAKKLLRLRVSSGVPKPAKPTLVCARESRADWAGGRVCLVRGCYLSG